MLMLPLTASVTNPGFIPGPHVRQYAEVFSQRSTMAIQFLKHRPGFCITALLILALIDYVAPQPLILAYGILTFSPSQELDVVLSDLASDWTVERPLILSDEGCGNVLWCAGDSLPDMPHQSLQHWAVLQVIGLCLPVCPQQGQAALRWDAQFWRFEICTLNLKSSCPFPEARTLVKHSHVGMQAGSLAAPARASSHDIVKGQAQSRELYLTDFTFQMSWLLVMS